MDIIDLTLITLEAIAMLVFAAYVVRYRKFFIGQGEERTYNLYLRSVWITYGAVALLCMNLLWGRLNIILGLNYGSLSNTLREYVMVLTMIHLLYAGLMHKDLWNNNKRK